MNIDLVILPSHNTVEELKKAGMRTLRDKEWSIEEGMIMKEERIYVLERKLRTEIV